MTDRQPTPDARTATLEREEYVEQAYLFRGLRERLSESQGIQDLLHSIRDELLATTKLPMAVDFLESELKHRGVFGPAMKRMAHYFTPFQTFLIEQAEDDRSRFDLRVALEILQREAEYMAGNADPQGIFMYHLESLCRNRLPYDGGLAASAHDPVFDIKWRNFILSLRLQVGMVELSDLIYVRSQNYVEVQKRLGGDPPPDNRPVLFGQREGQIALANRHKDPLLLFSALHRHLGYPEVPRPQPADLTQQLVPQLLRRIERLEQRLKLLEEEQRGGLDITKFYKPPTEGERLP